MLTKKRKVMIAIPTWDATVSANICNLVAAAGSMSRVPQHPFEYELFMPQGFRPVEYARNLCADAFLSDPEMERLYFIDADMNPPGDWFRLLLHDREAVSGLAFGWGRPVDGARPGVLTVAYSKNLPDRYISLPIESWEPFEADGVGAACLVLKRSLLERVREANPVPEGPYLYPFFRTIYRLDGKLEIGEDLYFFLQANKLGVRVLVDPRVRFGHMKTVDLMDVADFRYAESIGRLAQQPAQEAIA